MAQARAVKNVYIVAAKRTPFGAFGGKLASKTCTELMEVAARSALESGKVNPKIINCVIVGNVIQSASDSCYISRHVALRCGVPINVPAYTVNRVCGSGFQAIVNGAQEILLGDSNVVLVGGSENLSQAPFAIRGNRSRPKIKDIKNLITLGEEIKFEDTIYAILKDSHTQLTMAETAEKLADKYKITRKACDEYAFQSQTRWQKAHESAVFDAEIAPVEIEGEKGKENFLVDENPVPEITMETLAQEKSLCKKDGTVTSENSSYFCDGAAALVLASEKAVKEHKLEPLAKLVAYGIAGCDPNEMGIGPVPASLAALKAIGKIVKDMEIIEVNESYAAQYLAVSKELELNNDISNMNGGAIALGHPWAASGARITAHLAHELHRQNKTFAMGSTCIGGGQGMTVILEKC